MLTKWLSIPWGISPLICQTSFGVQVQPLETMSIWRSLNQLLWRASSLVERFPKPDSVMCQISLSWLLSQDINGQLQLYNRVYWTHNIIVQDGHCYNCFPSHNAVIHCHVTKCLVYIRTMSVSQSLLRNCSFRYGPDEIFCWKIHILGCITENGGYFLQKVLVTCYPALRGRKRS